MKLCIPTNDDRGLAATLAAHFGDARYLTIIDTETGDVMVERKDPGHHGAGSCETAETIRSLGADVVICRTLGRNAFARLAQAGLPVFTSDAASTSNAIDDYRSDRLRPMTLNDACGGRRHRHSPRH